MAAPLGDRTPARRRARRRRRGRGSSPTSSATAAARSRSTHEIRRRLRAAPRAAATPSCARSSTSSRAPSTATTSSRSARVGGAKRALVVVFTDLLEEAAARPLVDAVPVLARRHAVVVASVARPRPRRARRPRARRRRATSTRAAVALDVLAARAPRRRAGCARAGRRASSRRPPDALARRAASRAYLRAKARGAALSGRPRHDTSPQYERRRAPTPTTTPTGSAEPGGRHEALDEPGERRATAPSRARSRPPRRASRRSDSPRVSVPGLDERPAEPQPGGAADDDARELEHAVRERRARQNARAVAGADREPADHAEQQPLKISTTTVAEPERIPPANARNVTWMLFVKICARRTPPASPRRRGRRRAGAGLAAPWNCAGHERRPPRPGRAAPSTPPSERGREAAATARPAAAAAARARAASSRA